MGLRDLVDARHERSHAHGGSLRRSEMQGSLESGRHEITQTVLNVGGFPKKALSVLHPLKV